MLPSSLAVAQEPAAGEPPPEKPEEIDTQQIDVHDFVIRRIALKITQDDLFAVAVDGKIENLREKCFVLHGFLQLVGSKRKTDRLRSTTVNDAGYQLSLTTQAAARTFPHVCTHFGV